jgi:TolB protein
MTRRPSGVLLAIAAVIVPIAARAQDTAGVRIGITYAPGTRPTMAVARVAGPGGGALDSAVTILARDLDFSDRFEMQRAAAAGDTTAERLAAVGADWVASVSVGRDGARSAVLREGRSGAVRLRTPLDAGEGAALRRSVHRAADRIVEVVTGQRGIATTQVLYVRSGRIWIVDADGHGARPLRTAGDPSLSPSWAPDGRRFAYTAFVPAGQPIVIQDLATGAREVVPTTEYGLNITPSFAPDGRSVAFARGTEAGTALYLYELAGRRVDRLTAPRVGDDLSPTWSPDGTRLAFVSTRAGRPQLYAMARDGTGQEVLARFDFGSGQSTAPAWSPDGRLVAFHREIAGTPQLFVVDVASGGVRQLTGAGRNEDPAWAPDGRHLVFVSARSGARELWVFDVETGRLRPLTRGGGARLPAWSPHLEPSADGTDR